MRVLRAEAATICLFGERVGAGVGACVVGGGAPLTGEGALEDEVVAVEVLEAPEALVDEVVCGGVDGVGDGGDMEECGGGKVGEYAFEELDGE